jgi:acyl transferase domain-containing protein
MLVPNVTEVFRAAGMLSPSGRCLTLDAAADGYVRGEECRAISLNPVGLSSASGVSSSAFSAIVITGAAVNQDGRSSSLTVGRVTRYGGSIFRMTMNPVILSV